MSRRYCGFIAGRGVRLAILLVLIVAVVTAGAALIPSARAVLPRIELIDAERTAVLAITLVLSCACVLLTLATVLRVVRRGSENAGRALLALLSSLVSRPNNLPMLVRESCVKQVPRALILSAKKERADNAVEVLRAVRLPLKATRLVGTVAKYSDRACRLLSATKKKEIKDAFCKLAANGAGCVAAEAAAAAGAAATVGFYVFIGETPVGWVVAGVGILVGVVAAYFVDDQKSKVEKFIVSILPDESPDHSPPP